MQQRLSPSPNLRRVMLCAGLLVGLAGCEIGDPFSKPAITAPAAWDAASNTALAEWPDTSWWRGFASAELDGLMRQAESNNRDLAAALARIRQAEASARIAGAALLPTLGADGGAGRSWSPSSSSTSSTRTASSGRVVRNSFDLGLTAGYQVDLFGGNRAGSDAALERLAASRYDRETVALTLHADLATAYFQLLSVRDRIRLAEDTLRNAEDVLAVLERQRQLGVASELEVAQQRNSVASQRATIPALRQSERETLTAIALLLGRPPQGFAISTTSLDALALPAVKAGLPSALLARRPDIRKAEADLRAANRDIAVAQAARLPSLDLTMGAGLQSSALHTLLQPQSALYSLAASLTAPLFQGGRLEGQEDLNRARYQELAETYGKAAITAFGDVEDALTSTANAAERYTYAREAFDQAREAYRIVEARYRAGTVPFLNLLDAQRTVFQANDALAQALLGRYTALVDLYKALGGGWTE
ncbi:efflux transporter outer membrane subunit [Ferrovibrio sp.]|uniref:efflux transporter outer membrane subunit n=1 Tax=Ferrovibrio sp. TaxID=1917215 RepID=UPI001B46EA59|nr:efflux transporter outer membrane subunit [Ferrovibrio sp.]MBP7064309.1 efflux transporter outer membrane subunit [Ferrovibrio sp.]